MVVDQKAALGGAPSGTGEAPILFGRPIAWRFKGWAKGCLRQNFDAGCVLNEVTVSALGF